MISIGGGPAAGEGRVNIIGTELALAWQRLEGAVMRGNVSSICAMHHLSPDSDGIAYRRSFLQ
ncbi:hypothetical protein KQ945_07740 [Bacillus subtilis subsp. subtilis]|nr:hypothetical protein [Bacillus subtilis subsp. subtilis]